MTLWKHYFTPKTVDEALALLAEHQGNARVIAGGTDLLIDLRAEGGEPQEALVDITSIEELTHLTVDGDLARIGAGVTHSQIVKSGAIGARATCLAESCGVVGGPQVRNVATLGGNVAHALPAGDGTTSLVALLAEAEVVLDGVRQWMPIHALYKGAGKSLLDSRRDILLGFRVPLTQAAQGSAFSRIMRPQGVALPILGCAVWVKLDDSRTHYRQARICIAPVAPTPTRAEAVEAFLVGQPANEDTLDQAVSIALETLHPRASKYRATAEYRHEMIAVLLRRTLPKASQRAMHGEAIPEGIGA
ncbi:MAG: FAD binding domain-containing protein [Phototrophicaceae bacterium]|jgi:carbon-monoxide dehydrogenase medium subunit